MRKKNMHNISIIVNKGRFNSVAEASNAEMLINWWDDQDKDAIVCTECFAAMELRKHLCKLTGAEETDEKNFPFMDDNTLPEGNAILIGNNGSNKITSFLWEKLIPHENSKSDEVSPEGFYIKSLIHEGRNLISLAGNSRVGTLYAVYSFLENLGIRWFGLGEKGLQYCVNESFEIPQLNYFDYPRFKTRGSYSEIVDDTIEDFIDWLTRNRVNFAFLDKIVNPYNLKKRGIHICTGGHNIMDRFLNPNHEYPYKHKIFGGDEKPEDPYAVSKEYLGDADGDYVLTYFEAHPDWFGMVDGKRSSNVGNGAREGFGDNYCTSNEDATDELCKNIVNSLISGQLSKTDYINAWLLDNGTWCSCDVCKNMGNYSYRLAMVIYKLGRKIEEARRDGRLKRNIKILYPAYHETLPIPDHPLPDDFDYENCIVTYFPIERCYVHEIDDPACTETNQELMETYTQWTLNPERTYKGEIFVGEYYNVSAFASSPIPNMKIMKHDIPYYYSTGVRHMYYMHMTALNWGTLTLTNYQFQKMLWNPGIDVDQLLDEFYNMYYGKIASQMKEFYETLETATRNMKYYKHYQYHKGVRHSLANKLTNDVKELFPLKHMKYDTVLNDGNAGISVVETVEMFKKCRKLIDDALILADTEPIIGRVLEDEMRFTYGEDMVLYLYYMTRTNLFRWKGQQLLAKRAFERARFFAEKLEKETEAVAGLKRFDNMKNGLKATWCREAYLNYLKIYG